LAHPATRRRGLAPYVETLQPARLDRTGCVGKVVEHHVDKSGEDVGERRPKAFVRHMHHVDYRSSS
jgi:hypothetical protein